MEQLVDVVAIRLRDLSCVAIKEMTHLQWRQMIKKKGFRYIAYQKGACGFKVSHKTS